VPDRFTIGDAFGWTLLLVLGWWMLGSVVFTLAPNVKHDLVTGGGLQIIVSLVVCALFASRRSGQSWSELFAIRRASVPTLLVALLLGAALCPPSQWLAHAIQSAFPWPKEVVEAHEAMFKVRSPLHGVVLFLVASAAGPLVEELFFRVALFTALRRHATTLAAVVTTSLLFTMIHVDMRVWAPILPLSLVLGWARAHTGSVLPPLLAHGAFNGTTLGLSWLVPGDAAPAWLLVASGVVASLALSGLLWVLGNGPSAKHARELDGGLSS
jgi:membrane protease YdiL (CAAX protease family)